MAVSRHLTFLGNPRHPPRCGLKESRNSSQFSQAASGKGLSVEVPDRRAGRSCHLSASADGGRSSGKLSPVREVSPVFLPFCLLSLQLCREAQESS
jgi:hypothetical protein